MISANGSFDSDENVFFFRAAEQLVGIEEDPAKFTPSNTRFQRGSSRIFRKSRTHETAAVITPVVGVLYDATPVNVMEKDELVDGDFYLWQSPISVAVSIRQLLMFFVRTNRKEISVLALLCSLSGQYSGFILCSLLWIECGFSFVGFCVVVVVVKLGLLRILMHS